MQRNCIGMLPHQQTSPKTPSALGAVHLSHGMLLPDGSVMLDDFSGMVLPNGIHISADPSAPRALWPSESASFLFSAPGGCNAPMLAAEKRWRQGIWERRLQRLQLLNDAARSHSQQSLIGR